MRLGQTFFTQFVIVGYFVPHQNEIVSHFDEEDIILYIITFGNPWYGGETMYYNGVRQGTSNDIEIKIPFQHCRLHVVSPWVRHRLTLNFKLKKNVEHIQRFGNNYYGKYEKDSFLKYILYQNIIHIVA